MKSLLKIGKDSLDSYMETKQRVEGAKMQICNTITVAVSFTDCTLQCSDYIAIITNAFKLLQREREADSCTSHYGKLPRIAGNRNLSVNLSG